jgi:hypothetical protein
MRTMMASEQAANGTEKAMQCPNCGSYGVDSGDLDYALCRTCGYNWTPSIEPDWNGELYPVETAERASDSSAAFFSSILSEDDVELDEEDRFADDDDEGDDGEEEHGDEDEDEGDWEADDWGDGADSWHDPED